MMVKVKYYAGIREAVQTDHEQMDIEDGSKLRDLLAVIDSKYGIRVEDMPLFLSVNQEYCDVDVVLSDGDEVALLFPPSGG